MMATARERCLLWAPPGWRPDEIAPVFGLHLVERVVLAFRAAGVQVFLVGGDADAASWIVERLSEGRLQGVRVRRVSVGSAFGVPGARRSWCDRSLAFSTTG